MSDACRALGTPVVSGNASLYNESEDGPVVPTPVVGMLGILKDVTQAVRMAFQDQGDEIWLLGAELTQDASTLGGSEYLACRHGLAAGPIAVDLDAERALVNTLVEAAESGLLKSAHDCSDGGLAITLVESAIAGEIGAEVEAISGRLDAALFGEAGARAVVTITSTQSDVLAQLAASHNLNATQIGTVGSDRLTIGDALDVSLSTAAGTWQSALPNLLDG
jgi:phosphoribosylformylglycinamidine synthase